MMSFDHQNSYLEDTQPLTVICFPYTWQNRASSIDISISRLLRHVCLFLRPRLLGEGRGEATHRRKRAKRKAMAPSKGKLKGVLDTYARNSESQGTGNLVYFHLAI